MNAAINLEIVLFWLYLMVLDGENLFSKNKVDLKALNEKP